MKTLTSSLALALVSLAGCTKTYYPADPVAYKGKILKITVEQVKDRGNKFDVKSQIRNESDKSILLFFNGMECFKGDVPGRPVYRLGIGERAINIPAGSFKRLDFRCDLTRDVETGKYKIKFNNVFANPSNDGKTQGDIIAKDVVAEF